MKKIYALVLLCLAPMWGFAQVGEHRNQFAVGFLAGYNLNQVDFGTTKVQQTNHTGLTGGLMVRYTCEKYFKTICSIQMEFNYSQLGWEEEILDGEKNHIPCTDNPDDYERFKHDINYFQIPILAHLAWGKEKQGLNFFFNAGPVLGLYLKHNVDKNFTLKSVNYTERGYQTDQSKEKLKIQLKEKENKPKNKFDYGIAAGLGLELHTKHIGRFQVEGRYYYGLGNIYGDSKSDCFGRSAHQTIILRAAYLFDI